MHLLDFMNRANRQNDGLTFLRTKLEEIVPFTYAGWSAAGHLFRSRSFGAGAHVIEAGQIITELHFLLSGIARYYYLTTDLGITDVALSRIRRRLGLVHVNPG